MLLTAGALQREWIEKLNLPDIKFVQFNQRSIFSLITHILSIKQRRAEVKLFNRQKQLERTPVITRQEKLARAKQIVCHFFLN